MKVLICDPIGQAGIDLLHASGYEVAYWPEITPEQVIQEVASADALVVRSRTKVTREVIEHGALLKVIARSGTGVDTIDVAAAREKHIPVVNAPGANAESVAEHTFALLLALLRKIPETSASMQSGGWPKNRYQATELMGKTLGVVGFGAIGMRVAQLGSAFGMKLLVYNRTTTDVEKTAFLGRLNGSFAPLDELLRQSDVVTLHVALTPETTKCINAEKLALMKKTAYLVNAARGAVVDEPALIEKLKTGSIAGAALDVFETEPLPADSPLRQLSTVILTPHVGAVSFESENRASLMVAGDVDRVLKGEQPLHAV